MGHVNVLSEERFMHKRMAAKIDPPDGREPIGVYELVKDHWYLIRVTRGSEPERIIVARFDSLVSINREPEPLFVLAPGEDERTAGHAKVVVFADLGRER